MTDAGEKSALEIETDIERTREDMDDTIDAIKRKLSAEELVERAAAYVRNNSGDIAMNVGQMLKDNPAPFALMSVGLGWLLVSGKFEGDRSSDRLEGPYGGYYDSTSDIGGESASVKRKAAEAYDGISDKISDVMDDVSTKTSAAMDVVSERSHAAIEAGRSTARQHPLLLGAAGLAVGVAVALMLPRTHREDRAVGKARDDLVRQAKDVGKETVDKAKDVAGDAWQAAKQTVIDETAPAKDAKAASSGEKPSSPNQGYRTPGEPMAARKPSDAGMAAGTTTPGSTSTGSTSTGRTSTSTDGGSKDFGRANPLEAGKRLP